MRKFIIITCILFTVQIFAEQREVKGKVNITDKSGSPINDFCANAVIYLEPEDGQAKSMPENKAEIEALNSQFQPSILPIVKGTTVNFPNRDVILHNVFSHSKSKKFDLGLFRKGESKTVTFDNSGLVKVFCNIHPTMVANILILDFPYFATVKKDCSYSVKNVPEGKYKIAAWYQYGKGIEKKVSVVAKNDIEFNISHTKKIKSKHKNKHGKSYKKSY